MCFYLNRLIEAILISTHSISFLIVKKKITINYSKYAAMGFFQGTKVRVRKSRGKRAISVRADEVLPYFDLEKLY